MFAEAVAKYTADHLRSHIEDYLEVVSNLYTGNAKITLTVPKIIEPASVVGGMMKEFDQILPQYGIDISAVTLSEGGDNLWDYTYLGQINGLVSATSRAAVDKLVHRHAQAVFTFIADHQILHDHTEEPLFKITEFGFVGVDFSGAEDLGENEGTPVWLAGFSMDVFWNLSQDGPGQHG